MYDALQNKKFEFEKKAIIINEEYFNKLKIYLKFDVNTSISKSISLESINFITEKNRKFKIINIFSDADKEFYSFKKNDIEDDKFYLEINHVSLISRNSAKVLKIN